MQHELAAGERVHEAVVAEEQGDGVLAERRQCAIFDTRGDRALASVGGTPRFAGKPQETEGPPRRKATWLLRAREAGNEPGH